MFNPLRSTTIGALEQTLAFTEKRHELLAGNLANMSTPDYRGRDLDVDAFQAALADSIRSPEPSRAAAFPHDPASPFPSPAALFHRDLAMRGGAAASIAPGTAGMLGSPNSSPDVSASQPPSDPRSAMGAIVYHDNSDISLEEQVTQISKNKHLHDLAVTTMRSQFELMRAAITERA